MSVRVACVCTHFENAFKSSFRKRYVCPNPDYHMLRVIRQHFREIQYCIRVEYDSGSQNNVSQSITRTSLNSKLRHPYRVNETLPPPQMYVVGHH